MLEGMSLVAHARFTCANPPVNARAYRCASARTAAGVYTVTVDEAIPAADACIVATGDDPLATGTFCTVTHTSDTVKTVTKMTATNVAAETASLNVTVLRVYGG